MKGLILKDFYSLRSFLRIYLILYVVVLVAGAFVTSIPSFAISFLILLLSMLQFTNFSFDDASKWNCYTKSLPLPSRTVVAARYLSGLLLLCGAVVVAFAVGLPVTWLGGTGQGQFAALAAGAVTAVCLFLAMSALAFPACYQFGAEKGRYVMAGCFLAVFAIVMVFLNGISLNSLSEGALLAIGFVILCVCIALYCASFFLSVHIYQNKEY